MGSVIRRQAADMRNHSTVNDLLQTVFNSYELEGFSERQLECLCSKGHSHTGFIWPDPICLPDANYLRFIDAHYCPKSTKDDLATHKSNSSRLTDLEILSF